MVLIKMTYAPPIHSEGSGGGRPPDYISLPEDIKKDLRKIGAEYTLLDGQNSSLVDVIKLLVKEHNESSRKSHVS
jgi:hypothetical protein